MNSVQPLLDECSFLYYHYGLDHPPPIHSKKLAFIKELDTAAKTLLADMVEALEGALE